jgi:hypothetical protein
MNIDPTHSDNLNQNPCAMQGSCHAYDGTALLKILNTTLTADDAARVLASNTAPSSPRGLVFCGFAAAMMFMFLVL